MKHYTTVDYFDKCDTAVDEAKASMLTHPSQVEAQSYAVFSGIAHKQVRG